jgi:beta-galactosidase
MQAVGRGADGIFFFQRRQSRAGAERFHSAMLPHAGTRTRAWREGCQSTDRQKRSFSAQWMK